MRPTTLLQSFTILAATASIAIAQSPSAPPTAPNLNSPASGTTTSTTASSPASTTTTTTTSSSAMPSEAEMKQMMELAKLNDNHKLLASTAGTWSYTGKMWMDPK